MASCCINSYNICTPSSITDEKPLRAGKVESRPVTCSFFRKARLRLPNISGAGKSRSLPLSRSLRLQYSISCSVAGCKPEFSPGRSSTSGFSTLYELLGIETDVGFADIKSAYRKMARRYHPDVWPASHKEQSTEIFLRVHEAYDTLSDPTKRAHYDHQLLLHNVHFREHAAAAAPDLSSMKTIMKSQWEAQLATLKYRRRSSVMAESWGSRMRSSSCSHARN